jgi:hypothetical protein
MGAPDTSPDAAPGNAASGNAASGNAAPASAASAKPAKSTQRAAVPGWARKSTLVLAIAALAMAVFGTTTQTWIIVHLDPAQLGQAVSGQDGLQVQGTKAATTVTALALVALAGGLAASIGGRIARWIITAIILLAAAGIVGAAAVVLADPLAAAQGSIAAATGISGSSVKVDVTVFPALAVVAASLLGLSALAIVPAGRYWKTRTKYDAAAATGSGAGSTAGPAGPADEIDSWDRLSRGDDPT